MKKKYLVKQPSCVAIQRQERSAIANYSACGEHKLIKSHERIQIGKTRLKTDWPLGAEPLRMEAVSNAKAIRILKKQDGNGKQLRKGNYYFPSNK
jgi:hypothetical protein